MGAAISPGAAEKVLQHKERKKQKHHMASTTDFEKGSIKYLLSVEIVSQQPRQTRFFVSAIVKCVGEGEGLVVEILEMETHH